MANTYKFRTVVTPDVGTPVDRTVEVTADGADVIEASITNGSDRQVLIASTLAALKGYVIVSDQDMTLETNSSSSPTDTVSMTANVPLVWYTGCGYDPHFSANVTTMYFTNASGTTAALKIRWLRDITP